MATIDKGCKLVTLVNVFPVSPATQAEPADLLVCTTEGTRRQLPGFISASIHKRVDDTRVINYALWRTQAGDKP